MASEEVGHISLHGAKKLHQDLRETLGREDFGSLLLLDIDRFREVNAQHGEAFGDDILGVVGDSISRSASSAYRIGSDQFGLILTKDGEQSEIGSLAAGLNLLLRQKTGLHITVSGGAVQNPGQEFGSDPRMGRIIFSTCQRLLTLAKHAGGNRVLCLPTEPIGSIDLMAVTMRFYQEVARVSSSYAKEMEVESKLDFLTGLFNRRGFEDTLAEMVRDSQRDGSPIAVIYMDSDSLKPINDTKGHEAGDRFIVDISRVLNRVLRSSDFVSRWGSDEFAVLLREASEEKAVALGERIRHAIETRTQGTVSVGVYCGVPADPAEAVRKADAALYEAKHSGKNQVAVTG